MKRIFITNAEGKWFAMRLSADGTGINVWTDHEPEAQLFKPRDAIELVYRYNRSHVGVKAAFEKAPIVPQADIQETVRQEIMR